MKKEKQKQTQPDSSESRPVRVRLPSFLIEDEVGLGDIIKRATYAVGIKPCAGCDTRAAWLNRRVSFRR